MSHWEAIGASNEWYTPAYIFEALGETFDLDPAHPLQTTFVPAAVTYPERGLELPWRGFVWLNPPFEGRNGLVPWLNRFFDHGNGIALTPDRTSAPWFQQAWKRADTVLFMPKVKFIRPDGSLGKSPSNGTALWSSGQRGANALRRAAERGLGVLAIPLSAEAA